MPLYPYPNTSSIPELFNYTNTHTCVPGAPEPFTCGWFYPILLFTIFGIVLLSQKDRQPTENALSLSSFISFIIAVLFMPLGIHMYWVFLFFMMLLLSVINLWRRET